MLHPCALVILSLALCVIPPNARAQIVATPSPPALRIKMDETVLLLDAATVAKTTNLTQRFFPAKRHPANPVIRRTEKWEGVGPYIWGNRLLRDDATGDLRLWYIAYDFAGNFYRWGYATSRDGLHWVKPNLRVERYGEALARNLLPLGPHAEKGARTLAYDPRPTAPTDRKFVGLRFTYDGVFVSFSPDGISWHEHPANPVWLVPSDIIHLMWDEPRQRFVAYYKIWEVRGSEITRGDATRTKPFTAHMPWFNVKPGSDGSATFDGPRVEFRPNAPAEVARTTFVLRAEKQGADDGGGVSLSGAWTAKRVQCWAESDDGVHWRNEQVVMRADKRDPPTANIQFLFVMRHGGYYLGFPTLHDESGTFRIQFAWSSDGIDWSRHAQAPWLDVGPTGAFDSGMVLGPADPIFSPSEMWFPYGGFPIRHDSPERNWEAAIGLATIERDRFAAWESTGYEGELLTRPFVYEGGRLVINAQAPTTGSVRVEVLDAGLPAPGFEARKSRSISGDTLRSENAGEIQWDAPSELSALRGKRIQLRFILRDARLYSFRLAASAGENRATSRP